MFLAAGRVTMLGLVGLVLDVDRLACSGGLMMSENCEPACQVDLSDPAWDSDDLWDCGHDPSGGDCDYDCPRFARSHAGF